MERDPFDAPSWLELARLRQRGQELPVRLRQDVAQALLFELEAPSDRRLIRGLILPVFGWSELPSQISPLPRYWRDREVREDEAGLYDAQSGQDLKRQDAQSGISMLWVPGGTHFQGSLHAFSGSSLHQVEVRGFWMGRFPVSVEEFQSYLEAGGEEPPLEWEAQLEEPERPVVGVRHSQAEGFCRWAGLELPSEAQWEWAARGPEECLFPWGDAHPHRSRLSLNPGTRTLEEWHRWLVASGEETYDESPFGIREMGSQVLEWCRDWYHPEAWLDAPRKEPEGPKRGSEKVVRGNSFFTLVDPESCRAHRRQARAPESPRLDLGFRVVRRDPLDEV